MKLSQKLSSVYTILAAKIAGKRTPLLVNWSITNKCNRACRYCNIWNCNSRDLSEEQSLSMIDDLYELGTKVIHFTGGEPLLRSDIGNILKYCHKKNIVTSMNSNGTFVPQKISELVNLNLLGLSLDGPREVHDSIRGNGSYGEVLEAMDCAKEAGVRFRIITVLSRSNLGAIDFLLAKAQEYKTLVVFQPATSFLLGGDRENPIAPDEQEYKRVISELIIRKRKTKHIGNSLSGLNLLYHWPYPKRIRCLSHFISCRIESDGRVYACFRNREQGKKIDDHGLSIKAAFSQLFVTDCDRCWCASSVEINCLMSLRVDSMINSWSFI
ncbi:radical SAM protein [Candidatus Omnitrophota bacterium]